MTQTKASDAKPEDTKMNASQVFANSMASEIDNLEYDVKIAKQRVARCAADLARDENNTASLSNALAVAARELSDAAAQLEQTRRIAKHFEDLQGFERAAKKSQKKS